MNTSAAKLSVLVGERFACVKITGRANFNSSIDFTTVLKGLKSRGYCCFVLDLSECSLMDSTFLGALAGFGRDMNHSGKKGINQDPVQLLNPNPRILELLETLGVLHLFRTIQGTASLPERCEIFDAPSVQATREETTRACLEAHQTLMDINPENKARFKDVAQFLAEDLERLKGPGANHSPPEPVQ